MSQRIPAPSPHCCTQPTSQTCALTFTNDEVSVCLTLAQVQPQDFSESLPLLKRQHMKPDWTARGIALLLEAAS